MALRPRTAPSPPSRAWDAVIALGTRVRRDGRPGPALARRTAHAVALVRAGWAETLVLSGGAVAGRRAEADAMREMALAEGLPATRLVVEDRAASTFENALFCAPLLAARGWRRVLVVSDGYHLPRALFVFRRMGLEATGSAARGGEREPVSFRVAVRLREALVWPWYLWLVWIARRRDVAAARRAVAAGAHGQQGGPGRTARTGS